MKQKIKRIWLALCMALCLTALFGCSAAEQETQDLDPTVVMTMQQGAQQYLDMFSTMTDEEIDQMIETSTKNKDSVMQGALTSWKSVKEDLGGLVSSETAAVEETDDGYSARINAVFEKRNCEFTLMLDSNLAYLTSISFTPEYTFGEKMVKAAMNTLMGMGVVFCVLIFISFIISCFKYISVFEKKMKDKEAAKAAAEAPAPAPVPAPAAAPAPAPVIEEAAEEVTDDFELISVIAAAIAAAQGNASPDELIVRSIKRVPKRNWK